MMSGETYIQPNDPADCSISGESLFPATVNLESNPFFCKVCHQHLNKPVSLPCLHSFCSDCLKLSISSSDLKNFKCPSCGIIHSISTFKIQTDELLDFVVEASKEIANACANCDQSKTDMFFCETCHQPLCKDCKEQTHRPKMFSKHKIVNYEERLGANDEKLCNIHNDSVILFCNKTKSLACIQCFQNAPATLKQNYVDFEVAFKTSKDSLSEITKAMKTQLELMNKSLQQNLSFVENEKRKIIGKISQIRSVCQQLLDKLIEIRDKAVGTFEKDSTELEEQWRHQQSIIIASQPLYTLYLHAADILNMSAGKIDFLNHFGSMKNRIEYLISLNTHAELKINNFDRFDIEAEFVKLIQITFSLKIDNNRPESAISSQSNRKSNSSQTTIDFSNSPVHVKSNCCRSYSGSNSSKSSYKMKSYAKLRLLVDLAGAFGDEYAKIENEIKEINKRFGSVGKVVQEFQRDLTVRKCLISEAKLSEVASDVQKLKIDLGSHSTRVDDLQIVFQEIWEEQLDRVRKQQEVYRNHIGTVLCLREDLHRITTACHQLVPFVRCMATAISPVNPERCRQEELCPMQKICCQINTLEPNSQTRVDAIERHEQQRKLELEKKKCSEEELIAGFKRKLIKAPKDPMKRKSNNELSTSTGPSTSCVKNVDRERRLTQEIIPPPITMKTTNLQRRQHTTNPNSTVYHLSETFADLESFATESFLSSITTINSPKSSGSTNNTNTLSSATSSVANLLEISMDGSEASFCDISLNAACLEFVSSTLQRNGVDKPNIGNVVVNCSPNKILPSALLAKVDKSTLNAREKLLVSLKERVHKLDSNKDE